jgi:subtilase family serine protease
MMGSQLLRLLRGLICIAATIGTVTTAHAQTLQFQARHVPEVVNNGRAALVSPVDGQQRIRLAVHLPLRNQVELSQLLSNLYDPKNSVFHKYLSVEEFTRRFGPTEQDYNAVVAWAVSNGFTLRSSTPNRRLVALEGSINTVNQALRVTMNNYQHPTESRTFFSPDREPTTVGLGVMLLQVTGLDNYQLPHTHLHKGSQPVANLGGSGPSSTFLPSDMRAAYYGNGPLNGAGQSIGIFSLDGFQASDVRLYYTSTGMSSSVPINPRLVAGFNGACTTVTFPTSSVCNDAEQVLDIVNAIGMAPGITQVLFYEGLPGEDTEILNLMATDNTAKVLSSSWGWSPADQSSDDPIFQEFAAQGQTYLSASGDCGSYSGNCAGGSPAYFFPGVDAFITEVGGTDLTTTGPGGGWVAETAWPDSGGGYVSGTPIPSWQQLPGVINSSNNGSTTWRNTPDIAAEANFDNSTVDNGVFSTGWGGTSFAAPRWAGFLTLVNQQSIAKGKSTMGFINPTIYRLATSSVYTSAFHDITSGSNPSTGGGNSGFNAVAGYDLVTGWGSPNGTGLINQLTGEGNGFQFLVPIIELLLH